MKGVTIGPLPEELGAALRLTLRNCIWAVAGVRVRVRTFFRVRVRVRVRVRIRSIRLTLCDDKPNT